MSGLNHLLPFLGFFKEVAIVLGRCLRCEMSAVANLSALCVRFCRNFIPETTEQLLGLVFSFSNDERSGGGGLARSPRLVGTESVSHPAALCAEPNCTSLEKAHVC